MKRRLTHLLLIATFTLGLVTIDAQGQRRRWPGRDRRAETVYCESGDMQRHWCSEGIGRNVRLVRQRSKARCVRGRTWGMDRSGIWVDRGCRADFEVW